MSSLVAFVHVHDEDGAAHVFGPGDTVPEWARTKITNPSVWDTPEVPVPAKAGAKGGRDKWAAYAESKGVVVEKDWGRDDIIEHLQSEGVAVD